MSELYKFTDVHCEGLDRSYSFTLHSGDVRLLQLSSRALKDAMIDLAIGETFCREGRIEIMQSDRRHKILPGIIGTQDERRVRNESVPVIWHPLVASQSKRVGWVAAHGGLISNLKIWENVTLPLWFHARREVAKTEQSITHWLGELGLMPDEFAEFMSAPPSSLESWQRKLAGLLRALVQMPQVLVVDATVFDEIKEHLVRKWIIALETFAAQGRTVLVIAEGATHLPWEKIE